ncbi:hypothetical protein U8Q05_37230 (plasmid) [Rhizobium ruizarguesonis]|nr:hypothetical protein U8Q05_37230 [Rhizobium ruizarguesonis]
MHVHYCEEKGCEEWGGWGNSHSPAVATRWWCFEHFPHKSYEQETALRKKLDAAERDVQITSVVSCVSDDVGSATVFHLQ